MKSQNMFLMASLVLALGILSFGCEEQSFHESLDTPQSEPQSRIYHYIDQSGAVKSFEIEGSTMILKDENGLEERVELNRINDTELALRTEISSIKGHLENSFRGTLHIFYKDGVGTVDWKMRPDLFLQGDIECLNVVGDQLILQIMITSSTSGDPFAVGQRITTTVKDNGKPDPSQGIYDQIAKVLLIYAGPDECYNQFLPNVNNLIGFDNSNGDIGAE